MKANKEKYGLEKLHLIKEDIHIHVPEGGAVKRKMALVQVLP